MSNDNRRFQGGSGVYECSRCHKRTRKTGVEAETRLCKACFHTSSLENQHTDNHGGRMEDCAVCQADAASLRLPPVKGDVWCDNARPISKYQVEAGQK